MAYYTSGMDGNQKQWMNEGPDKRRRRPWKTTQTPASLAAGSRFFRDLPQNALP